MTEIHEGPTATVDEQLDWGYQSFGALADTFRLQSLRALSQRFNVCTFHELTLLKYIRSLVIDMVDIVPICASLAIS